MLELPASPAILSWPAQGAYVFINERGQPFARMGLGRMIERAGEAAGLPFPVHVHMLRHSTGYALAAGALLRRTLLVAVAAIAMAAVVPTSSRADAVGAAFGAGTGLIVAGPPGAIVGGVVGAVWGHPFWGPPNSPHACWIDNFFYRHCRYYSGRWHYY